MSLPNPRGSLSLSLLLAVSAFTGSAQAQWQFGPAVELPISISVERGGPSLSNDGRVLYFASPSPGGQGEFDIWTASRSTRFGSFGPVTNLGPNVNSSSFDAGPSISQDGLSLYFHSTRPGSLGDRNLYVATRATTNDAFGAPVSLGPGVNSSSLDANPSTSADGLTLVFQSDRPGFTGQDLFVATRPNTSVPFGAVQNLGPTINRFVGQGSPSLSADGLSLFYAGSINGAVADLFVSTRASLNDPWGDPVSLGPNVNTPSDEDFGAIAWDSSSIVFISNRSGGEDLYEAVVVPEPSTMALFVSGLCVCGLLARLRKT
jgi:Tol biopolymer transport system component